MAKVNVKTGLQSRSNETFRNYHTTTTDFFQLDVAYFREVTPQQSLKLNLITQARLSGMPVPSYADIQLNRKGFFVPFRTIFKGWNAFIEQQPYYTPTQAGIQQFVPKFNLWDMLVFFQRMAYSVPADVSATEYDFMVTYTQGSSVVATTRNFTDKGRQAYKVLTQLGYSFKFENQSCTQADLEAVEYSALPLLAYAKVYADYYIPTQYRDFTTVYTNLQFTLASIRDSYEYTLTTSDIDHLLAACLFVTYGHDYFTDAFDRPTGNNVLNADVSIVDPAEFRPFNWGPERGHNTVDIPQNYLNSDGTPVLTTAFDQAVSSSGTQANLSKITQFGLTALMKMTAWMKRKQIAGSRVLENYLAEYGIKLPAVNLDMSVYLKGDSIPVIIKDVTATSQTLNSSGSEGANLGDYAGQGRVYPNSPLDIECDANGEFGFFMVLTSLVPKIGYVQGVRRRCLHITPMDFFHGDFDGVGNREIRLDELAVPDVNDDGVSNTQKLWDECFGFTPQYSEYKVSHDTLSGDFRIGRLNRAGFTSDAWHLNRMFEPDPSTLITTIPKHSLSFLLPFTDKSQYSRIFYVLESAEKAVNADHFVLNHIQVVESSAPFKPLYEDYSLEHIDGNKSVTLDANGNTLN